jgi:hypothetical protein
VLPQPVVSLTAAKSHIVSDQMELKVAYVNKNLLGMDLHALSTVPKC